MWWYIVLGNVLSHQDMLAIYHLEHMQANGIIITITCNSLWFVLCVSTLSFYLTWKTRNLNQNHKVREHFSWNNFLSLIIFLERKMNLEDELFDVLGISSAETWKLRVRGRKWGKSRKVSLLGVESAYTLIKEWDMAPTAFLVPSSVPCSSGPTFQAHCFEQETLCLLGPQQGCGWTGRVVTPSTIHDGYPRKEHSLVKDSGSTELPFLGVQVVI